MDPALEQAFLESLLSPLLQFPMEAADLFRLVEGASAPALRQLLSKFEAQQLLSLAQGGSVVASVDLDRVSALVSCSSDPVQPSLDSIEDLLNTPSVRETENKRMGSEVFHPPPPPPSPSRLSLPAPPE